MSLTDRIDEIITLVSRAYPEHQVLKALRDLRADVETAHRAVLEAVADESAPTTTWVETKTGKMVPEPEEMPFPDPTPPEPAPEPAPAPAKKAAPAKKSATRKD